MEENGMSSFRRKGFGVAVLSAAVALVALAAFSFSDCVVKQTSAESSSSIVWGLHVGDKITWSHYRHFFSDWPAPGESEESSMISWEVLQLVSDGSVMIRETTYTYGQTNMGGIWLPNTPTDSARTVESDVPWLEIKGFGGALTGGIFPIIYYGKPLSEIIDVDFTLDMTYTDYGDYMSGYGIEGATWQGNDFPKTYWLDVSVHKGTGVVYSAEWYDDDDEYGYTNMETLGASVNFEWTSRPPYTPMSVSISADRTSGTTPLTVSFSASVSGGASPYTYLWEFGDGSTSTSEDVSHTYQGAGSYTPTLTTTDAYGITQYKSLYITATVPPSDDDNPDDQNPDDGSADTSGGALPMSLIAVVAIIAVAIILSVIVYYIWGKGRPGVSSGSSAILKSEVAAENLSYCIYCGYASPPGTTFCTNCGQRLK